MALRAVTEHPKFSNLKRLIGRPKGPTLGYLECIWHFCGKYSPQGNIGKYTIEEIEAWAEWDGEPGAMVAAMVKSRWLDQHPEHGLIVHDWHKHADDATKLALKRASLAFIVATCRDTVATPSPHRDDYQSQSQYQSQESDKRVQPTVPASGAIIAAEPEPTPSMPKCNPKYPYPESAEDVFLVMNRSGGTREMAQDFFLKFSAVNWIDKNHRAIHDWKARAASWVVDERSGRNRGSPTNPRGTHTPAKSMFNEILDGSEIYNHEANQ